MARYDTPHNRKKLGYVAFRVNVKYKTGFKKKQYNITFFFTAYHINQNPRCCYLYINIPKNRA